jgi:hypothetical protein
MSCRPAGVLEGGHPVENGLHPKASHLDGCRRTRCTGDFAPRAGRRRVWGSALGRDLGSYRGCIASVRSSLVPADAEYEVLIHTG